ncbi:MAG: ATP-dependent RecD-like DNA helicase [Magnetococcus sp. WYHC-3]
MTTPSHTKPPADASDAPIERITGTVESIVYRSEETGYTVCSVKPSGRDVASATVVGNTAAIWAGEELIAEGRWTRHPQHGRQFQAEMIQCITPTSVEGLRRYLASGLIRGVGPVMADRIVATFGAQTLDIIEKESRRLEEVEGIGPQRRQKIKESWTEQHAVRDIMIFLQSHGIGTAQAARIYRQYGADAIAVVKRNPYRLCHDVWGIGFKTADSIALRVGIPKDSPLRACAGLSYLLSAMADEGHCYAPEAELVLQAQAMLDIPVETLGVALTEELAQGRLVREQDRIYLRPLFESERRVAAHLRRMLDARRRFPDIPAAKAVAWAERKMKIELAPAQRDALLAALESKVAIITGGPGVGKTTIIRALVEIFGARKLVTHLAAPTGRAARRMSEATGHDAQTIHRLLKYLPAEHAFSFTADNPLEGDAFIVDESSMMDIRLMDQFVQALPLHACLILVGDIDQLPSVGPGNVLRDAIQSGALPCRRLTTIFRQDASGLIVRNAHHVNNGEKFETAKSPSDFYFVETEEPERILERVVDMVTRRMPQKFHFDAMSEIQVLSPMRRGLLGTENLNSVLQQALNPSGPALTRGGTTFRRGDRVMQIHNNYDKEVFNGDIGFVKTVDEEDRALVVIFDGRPVRYETADLDELVLAYACTIHKSQGSEYPAVVVLLHTQHFKLLQRNLLYTAITRGRKLVCVVGSAKAVGIAIRNNEVRERRTTLRDRLGTCRT